MISMILLIGCVSAEETVDIKAHVEIDCYYCLSNWHVFLMDALVEHAVPPGAGFDPYDFPMPPSPSATDYSSSTSSYPGGSGLAIHSFSSDDLPMAINLTYVMNNPENDMTLSWDAPGENYTFELVDYGDDSTYQNQIEIIDMSENLSISKTLGDGVYNYFLVYITEYGGCNPPLEGNWVIRCSENCTWEEDLTVKGNMSLIESGSVMLKSVIKFFYPGWRVYKGDGCTLKVMDGGRIG